MERRESLRKLFQDLGCKIESDAVLDKCFEFCESYDVDVEKLTELWLTFCVNNDTDIDPTVGTLLKMERAILKKDHQLHGSTTKSNVEQEESAMEKHFIANETTENDDVLSMYGCTESGPAKRRWRIFEARISERIEKKKKRRRRRRKQHRYRILRGGTVIPATKIAQVDPSPLLPPALVRLSSRRIPRQRGGRGEGNPFPLAERRRRVRCSSRGTLRGEEGSSSFPLPGLLGEPSRSLSKGTISVFKDSGASPSVRRSRSLGIYAHLVGANGDSLARFVVTACSPRNGSSSRYAPRDRVTPGIAMSRQYRAVRYLSMASATRRRRRRRHRRLTNSSSRVKITDPRNCTLARRSVRDRAGRCRPASTNRLREAVSRRRRSRLRDGVRERARSSPKVEINADARTDRARVAEYSFSPASYAENSIVPTQRNVTDKGKILFSIGETIASWKRTGDYDVKITKSDEPHVPSDARYMYEILSKQGHLLTFVCQSLGSRLFKTWSTATGNASELRYVKNVRSVNQTNFRTFGRINAKKESANIVTLEGSTRRKGVSVADTIDLDFRNLKQYSVFSGQIVAVEAINPVGDALYVKEIFTKSYAPLAPTPRIESRVNVFVAAGPFTASNNVHYQPLWDLMEKVASDEPQVLILIGPFLEYTHPEIQDNLIKDTHQELFEKILMRIMDSTRKSTQVVLVASNRDAHQEPVFPTPEYPVFNRKLLQNYSNLKLMPDPCILDVAGLKIGITSVDVIKHIGKEEISNVSGDRLSRLADHVLAQTCFYPVYPPSEDLNVDTELWEKYAFFDQQPHLLILPSDMRCYCKVINECMILNPERMHKHAFARLSVKPALGGKWSSNNISCEIAKV